MAVLLDGNFNPGITNAPADLPSLPESIYLQPKKLLAPLGTFWLQTYSSKTQLEGLYASRGVVEMQTMLDIAAVEDSIHHRTTPVFHRRIWQPFDILESERNSAASLVPHYGDGTIYGTQPDGTYRKYGQGYFDFDSVWKAPANLHHVPIIVDQIESPNCIMTYGLQFLFDAKYGLLRFRINPFESEAFAPAPVLQNGEIVDRRLTLWMYQPDFDRNDVYLQHGYVLRARSKSSVNYRDVVSTTFDAIVGGTAMHDIRQILADAFDIPLAKAAETIEYSYSDEDNLVIVGSDNVYKFPLSATAAVVPGDTVEEGESLIEGFLVADLNRGQIPDIFAVAVGTNFLGGQYASALVFQNQLVVPTIETVAGKTKFSFPLGGFPIDVELFWDEVHARGIASGATLAELLDTRTNKVGQPQAQALPATINPLGFLLENVFRFNAFLVVIDADAVGEHATALSPIQTIRRLLPPHVAALFVIQLPQVIETVTMDDTFDTIDNYPAMDLVIDASGPSDVDNVDSRIVNGTCQ